MPAAQGTGSGREKWITYGLRLAQSYRNLGELLEEQSAAIKERDAEITLLRRQIAKRKPKGGRPTIPEAVARAVEAKLEAGASRRVAAARAGCSPATVNRIARRARERERAELVAAGAS